MLGCVHSDLCHFYRTPGWQITKDSGIASQALHKSPLHWMVILLSTLHPSVLFFRCSFCVCFPCILVPSRIVVLPSFPESRSSCAPSSVPWPWSVFQHHEQCPVTPTGLLANVGWNEFQVCTRNDFVCLIRWSIWYILTISEECFYF